MEIKAGYIALTRQEVSTLLKQINEKKCKICKNAAELHSGRYICRIGFTFPRCYESGKFRLSE